MRPGAGLSARLDVFFPFSVLRAEDEIVTRRPPPPKV
jgi:hypothetical protein